MRPVSKIVHDCRATIDCTSDVGDKSGESGIPVTREKIISRRREWSILPNIADMLNERGLGKTGTVFNNVEVIDDLAKNSSALSVEWKSDWNYYKNDL